MRDKYFVFLVAAVIVVGCQSRTDVSQNDEKKWDENSTAEQVDSEQPSNEQSDRANLAKITSSSTEPHLVCRGFMELLQLEKTSEAQNLLTRKARALTLRFDLPLGFPGDANATFQVDEAKFATSKQKMAQVNCEINESVSGQDVSSEIAWMLKRESQGWRICGMMLPTVQDQPMEFFSFESVSDVNLIKKMVSGEPAADQLQAMIQAGLSKF